LPILAISLGGLLFLYFSDRGTSLKFEASHSEPLQQQSAAGFTHSAPPANFGVCTDTCGGCRKSLDSSQIPEPFLVEPAESKIVGDLRQLGETELPWQTFEPLFTARLGDYFHLNLAGVTLPGTIDSITRRDEIAHVGFRLAEEEGRLTLSWRSDGMVSGFLGFAGQHRVFALKCDLAIAEGNNGGVVSLVATTLDKVLCAKPGAVYRLPVADFASIKLASPVKSAGTPILSSLPSSDHVIFCDFDGAVVDPPAWSFQTINAAAHPKASDAAWVESVWKRVAEDFAPFNVNVTTDPAAFDAASVDQRVQCIITSTTNWYDGADDAGGVARRDSFGMDVPCWVWTEGEYNTAEAISHEVGHTFGLRHHGQGGEEYYGGHGSGATGWGPIMGSVFFKNVTQWSNGSYADATNPGQDDLAVIAATLPVRIDDAGDTAADARPMTILGSDIAQNGIIERSADDDWYQFTTTGGPVFIQVDVLDVMDAGTLDGPNLAVNISLWEDDGISLLAADSPTDDLGASITASVPAGTYMLQVRGAARGTVDANFTSYGSLGQYTISGTVNSPGRLQVVELGSGVEIPSGSSGMAETEFGRLFSGQTRTLTYRLRNVGSLPLELLGATDSAQFQVGSLTAQTLAPGEDVNLSVIYQPNAAGTHTGVISIDSDDSDRDPYTFGVSGTSVLDAPDLGLTIEGINIPNGSPVPAESEFRPTPIGSSVSANYRVQNTGSQPLSLQSISSDSPDFLISASAQTIAVGEDAEFTVTFSPTASGFLNGTITLRSNDPDEDPFTFQVGGHGFADEPDIRVVNREGRYFSNGSTANYFISPATVNGFLISWFFIDSAGTQPLTLQSVEVDSNAFNIQSIEPSTKLPGDFFQVLFDFSPPSPGLHSGEVTIRSDDPDEDPFTFTITAIGRAPGPQLLVTRDFVDIPNGSQNQAETAFPDLLVGSVATTTVRLVNIGVENLQITSMADDSPHFDVETVVEEIAPGSSYRVDITFQPGSLGVHTAQVSVLSNDSDDDPYTFVVTGNAVSMVSDNDPPVIELIAGASFHPLGFTYDRPPRDRALDIIDGPVPLLDDSSAMDTEIPGTNVVTYTATDSAGNTATATRLVIVVDEDTDGDGMPNSWEIANGLDLADSRGTDGADEDNDGDGFSNLDEYLADTGPWDPRDLLLLTKIARQLSGNELRFTAKSTRMYGLEISGSLEVPSWTLLPEFTRMPGTPDPTGQMRLIHTDNANQLQFYRVRAELP